MEKVKVMEFAGRMIVIAHIESYWIDDTTVYIQTTGGIEASEDMNNEEDAKAVIKNIHDFITNGLHV